MHLFTGTKSCHHIQCSKLLLPMWQYGIHFGSWRLQQSHFHTGNLPWHSSLVHSIFLDSFFMVWYHPYIESTVYCGYECNHKWKILSWQIVRFWKDTCWYLRLVMISQIDFLWWCVYCKVIVYDWPIWFSHYCSLNQPLGEVSQMWPEEHQIISFKLSKLPFSSMCCENRCEHLLDQGPSKITSEYQSAMQNSRSPHWSMQEMLLSWKKASVPCKSHARVLKPFRWSKGHLLSTLALPF